MIALTHSYPFLRPTNIPADTYAGQSSAVRTIGVDTVFLCRSELDDSLVYQLTRQFFESLPKLSLTQKSLRRMELQQAPASPIPLHEGAARYYREQELLR